MEGWHYPRTELAEQHLGLLALGISSSLSIIAPRRKGKMLFILQDLAPLSQKKVFPLSPNTSKCRRVNSILEFTNSLNQTLGKDGVDIDYGEPSGGF